MFRKAQKRPLDESDLYETLHEHKSGPICENFSQLWKQELETKKRPHLLRVVNKAYGLKVLSVGAAYSIVEALCR